MNSFGLGLVLNFTDNATAGMGNATRALQQMSSTADSVASSVGSSITSIVTASYALDSVGSTLVNAGSSIIDLYGSVSQSVINAGMEMQGYRMQLSALYGSMDAGEAKMQEIKDYAMSSVFDIQSLIPAVTTMKAVGIEAMDDITTSSGKSTQKLLDYASDLAAMMPNMRNAYGTGVSAAMGAFKEYIAEGNALSLKRGAGLDITQILGEAKGTTIEQRTQQVADLIEKLNIVGYTTSLAGTPTQRLSNMQDALFNSLTKIADSGVFEKYCDLLEMLSNWVFSLVENEETFNVITGVAADTVSTLLSPLESILGFIIENSNAIIEWIKNNEKLTKNILLVVAAVGAFLVVGGTFLKFMSAIGMASAGFSFLKGLPTILSTVGSAFGGLVAKALPFASLAAIAYFVWKENLFGIRDTATKVMSDLGSIFSLVSDAWGDNTLSEENFQKANNLGILPLIEGLLQLKYYWDFFIEGLKTGFKSFFEGLADTLNQLGIVDIDINAIVSSIGEFLKSLVEVGAEDKWASIGNGIGKIAGALVSITVVMSALKGILPVLKVIGTLFNWLIIKPISLLGKMFNPVVTGFTNIITVLKGGQGVTFFSKLVEVLKAVFAGGMKLKDALSIVFGTAGTVIAGVVSLIVGVVGAVTGFIKQLRDGFSWVWEIVKWVGLALAAVGAVILGIVSGPVAAIVAAVIGVVTTIIVLVKQYWNEISAFFKKIGTWIYDNVILPVANFFVNLWEGIVTGVTTAFNAVKNFLVTIASWVYNNVIAPIANFFMTYIFPIIAKIVEIVAKIVEIVVALIRVFVQWVYDNVITPIINFFVGLWNTIVAGVTAFVERVKSVISTIVSGISENIVTPIAEFFSSLWSGIVEGVTSFIEDAKKVFLTIVEWIKTNIIDPIASFFATLWEGITAAFDVVADTISSVIRGAVNVVLGFVSGVINGFIRALNFAIGIINAIPGVEITKITELSLPELAEGGVATDATAAIIGEGKDDEAVLPLNTEVFNKIAEGISRQAPAVIQQPQNQAPVQNDYSVTFSAGSIVIQLANATDAELEKAAEKLMKIIERKQQLKAMAVRA